MRILVVEDERKIAKALKEGLEAEAYSVEVARSGEDSFFLLNLHQPSTACLQVATASAPV
jgi:DNA-binding response OmpR family regulator